MKSVKKVFCQIYSLRMLLPFFMFAVNLIINSGWAYSEAFSGVVKDAKTGKPVPGVSVYLIHGKTGGITARDGSFSLNSSLTGDDTLRCRHIDYRPAVIPVTVPGKIQVRIIHDIHSLETVIVSAKRPDETPPEKRTSASVNVIDKKDIPERAATAGEVLDNQAGIDVRSLGGTGSMSEISIRGSTAEQVAVYLDGVPLSAGGSGINGLSFIPMSQVQKMEVYRGSSPGMFGSGAIGGVVNITTLRDSKSAGVDASASYGSFGTTHQAVMTNFGLGNGRFILSAGRNASENDFRFYDDRGTTINKSDDGWETRKNSDYESVNFLARAETGITESQSLMVKFSGNDSERGVSGLGRKPALHSRLSSDMLLLQTSHRYRESVETQVWLMRDKSGFYDPKDEAGRRGRQDTDDTVIVRGITSRFNHVFGPLLAHGSLEAKNESFESSDAFYSAVVPPSRRKSLDTGIEGELMMFKGSLWITPRIHYTFVDDHLSDTGILLANSTQDSTMNIERRVGSAALGIRWHVKPSLTLRFNGGVFPRLPEFNELFGDTGDIVGNTKLTEEKGRNFDTGAHYSSEKLKLEADYSAFYRYAKDLIQRRNYGDYMISENIGKAEISGFETWGSGAFFNGIGKCRIALAYQDARNRSDETLFRKQRYYGKLLPYHPKWKGSADLTAIVNNFLSVTWNTNYESECFKGPSNLADEKLEARAIHSLEFRLNLPNNASLVIEAENLTDNNAPDRWGYPKPGRGYYATMSWNWERDNKKAE